MSAPETLSASRATYRFYKYVPSAVGIAFLVFVVVPFGHEKLPWPEGLLVLCLMAVPVALIVAYVAQFKHVSLLDTCLVVSDGTRAAHIPLGQIREVSKTAGFNPDVVLVVLRSPSPFGRRILFIPASDSPLLSFQENPVVKRLRRLCEQHPTASCPHDVSARSPTSAGLEA